MQMTETMRKLLSARSVRDKIALALDARLRPGKEEFETVRKLVEDGYLVWLDRAQVAHIRDRETLIPTMMDIYLLTPKGVALCDEHGIKQH
jgi:hypothetical protein